MSSDLALIVLPAGEGPIADLAIEDDDLVLDDTPRTPALLSLLTDARADGQRGNWADAYPRVDGDITGSTLWTLDSALASSDTTARAEQGARDSLAWMVDDGVATSVEIDAQSSPGRLSLTATIVRDDDEIELEFANLWGGA